MGYADLLKAIFYVLITWVVNKSQITLIKIIKTQWLVPKILGDGLVKRNNFELGRTQYIDNINNKIIMIITGENKTFKRKYGRALNLSASQSKRAFLFFRTSHKPLMFW